MVILGIAFGAVGLAHAVAGPASAWFGANVSWARQVSLHEPFVWVVVLSTLVGLGLSFTRARTLDGAGASKIGTLLLYILIACIGMQMDIKALADRPWLFALGLIWISVHIVPAVVAGQGVAGAVLLFRHGFAEQYRRASVRAGGGICVPSVACAGGRVAGRAGLCDRYGAGLYRRDHVKSDGRGMSL